MHGLKQRHAAIESQHSGWLRHHLVRGSKASLVDVCRDVGGIQAQVMSAAELSLWTRRRQTTRADVKAALWTRRDLVKTTSMRRTLHLLPARDFQMYIAAMQAWSMSQTENLLKRIGASPKHVDTMIDVVMDALADGPKTQQDLLARAKLKASKGMRRLAAVRLERDAPGDPAGPDRLCGAARRRGDVRARRSVADEPEEDRSRRRAARARDRSLTAFGPATRRDFSKWFGLPTSVTKPLFDQLDRAIEPVTVEGERSFVLRSDLAELSAARPTSSPTLLPSFDTFLLAHAVKDHLVEPRFYKRVYRNQGWLSPVVLVNGRIVAIWFLEEHAKSFVVDVQPFSPLDAKVRRGIAQEADALGTFLGARCDALFA